MAERTEIVIDGHVHLAQDVFRWNRDVTRSVVAIRQSEAGMTERGRGRGTIALPELRRGRVAVIFGLVCVTCDPDGGGWSLRTPEATYAYARAELTWYLLQEGTGLLRFIADLDALDAHLAEWKAHLETAASDGIDHEVPAGPPIGIVLAMEGCDPILAPDQLQAWWEDGLRVASLSHYGMGRYAAGTGPSGGVTDIGRELLAEMERLGMVLDTAHLSEQSFFEAVELFHGPIAFTHGGTRSRVPMWRSISDDQIRIIVERGGVVATSMDNWQITRGWVRGESVPEEIGLEAVVDHTDHICQLAGNADHAAIGSDLDGGFGTEQTPREIESIADLRKIATALEDRGYSDADVAKVMSQNWIRLLRQAWNRA